MLKALELQKAIDEKRQALEAINKRDFITRRAEIKKRLADVTVETAEEEKQALELEAQALCDEEAESNAEAESVRAEIEKLEKELDEQISKAPNQEPEGSARSAEKENKMEVRNTPEYIEAYAAYIRSEGKEKRAILTEQATGGTIPVPAFVYDVVKTAWERDGIIRRVRKAALKGNIKVSFEISGTDATVHTEGGAGVTEEELVLGVVTLQADEIKKWVSVSDKVLDYTGDAENFLRYIYDELTYKIALKAADLLLSKIIACGTQSTTTQVAVPVVTVTAIGLTTIANAKALLSGEARNPIIVMNRETEADFIDAQAAGSFAFDPFRNLPVEYNNSLKAFSAATTGDTVAIVGDFEEGALANFPNGEAVEFKFDDKTLMTQDLVRILGKRLTAIEPVAPKAFVKVVKG